MSDEGACLIFTVCVGLVAIIAFIVVPCITGPRRVVPPLPRKKKGGIK